MATKFEINANNIIPLSNYLSYNERFEEFKTL